MMKSYLFYVDLPVMEDNFYFQAEKTPMKEPPIADKELQENEVVYVRKTSDVINIKGYSNSSTKIALDEVKKYQYEDCLKCKEPIDKLFFHYHNLFEVSIVLSGKGYYFVNGEVLEIKEGSVVLFNKLVPHAWLCSKEDIPIQKTFNFYPTILLAKELDDKENYFIKMCLDHITYLHVKQEDSEYILKIFEQIYKEYINKKQGYKTYIKNLLIEFFIEMTRRQKRVDIPRKHKVASREIEVALEYMKSNFHLNITLDEVAKQVYMHQNYFSTVFKKKCGVSFAQYMNILKLSMATELMQSTTLAIEEISVQSGFASLSNFYRVFKEHYGLSPSRYAKEHED